MKLLSRLLRLFLCALAVSIAPGCDAGTGADAQALLFMAGYRPQANLPFVGVYVAEEKGFFEAESLNVVIQHSAGGGEHLQLLVSGKVQVTTQDASVLLKRRAAPGLPLVSIGLIGQRGQQAFAALGDSGIESLADWQGRTIGFKGTPPPDLLALLDTAGLAERDVSLVNVGFDPRVLVEGLVDIYPVFTSNEPYLLRSWGYDVQLWEAADYDIPTLGLVYVTTEEEIARNPERLARFVRAALQGIAYAEANLDEAVEITLKYTGPEADPAHMRYMLQTEIEEAHSPLTEEHGIGWQTAEQWQALLDSLLRYEAIEAPVDVNQAFTNRFLPTDE